MKIAISIPGYGPVGSGLPSGVPTGGLDSGAGRVIFVFINIILLGAIIFALWLMLTGGIVMIRSRGNKEAFMRSWNKVLFAIIGLAIIFLIFLIMNLLSTLLGTSIIPLIHR